jgi:hypothetical protein
MKNINEELSYMKYLLSYQKGRLISEQVTTPPTQYNVTNLQNTPDNTDTQYMCSANDAQLIDTIDNEVKGVGDVQGLVDEVTNLTSIPSGSDQDGDYKTQTQTLINEIQKLPTTNLEKLTIDNLRTLISEFIKLKKPNTNQSSINQPTVEPSKTEIQEQDPDPDYTNIIHRSFPELYPYLQRIKPWMWITMAAYFICVMLRCLIYKLQASIGFKCASKWKKSIIAAITQILLLDFKNLKNRKNNKLYGCNWILGRKGL